MDKEARDIFDQSFVLLTKPFTSPGKFISVSVPNPNLLIDFSKKEFDEVSGNWYMAASVFEADIEQPSFRFVVVMSPDKKVLEVREEGAGAGSGSERDNEEKKRAP